VTVAPHQAELLAPEFTPSDPPPAKRAKLDPEDLFAAQCRSYRLPRVEQQHYFAKCIGRRWRFDFAFPDYKLAVEIEGLVVRRVWSAELQGGGPVTIKGYVANVTKCEAMTVAMGRHATITGFREDTQKYNTAAMLGWTVIRFLQNDVKPGHAIEMTQRVLAAKGWKPNHT
jgi:very-short-patch-repair endonuclease